MNIRDRIKELRRLPASELLPNPKNWRRHPQAQQDAMRAVLQEIGYAGALLAREVDGKVLLIDGHLRAEITPADTVPVLILDVNEQEADKLLVTYDPLSAMAEKDDEALKTLLKGIQFEEPALKEWTSTLVEMPREPLEEPLAQIDKAEELRKKWHIESGQTWQIGPHTLVCADCLTVEWPAAQVLLTDPPYGINIVHVHGDKTSVGDSQPFGSTTSAIRHSKQSGWGTVRAGSRSNNSIIAANNYHPIVGDDKPFDPTPLLDRADKTVLWGANYYADKLPSTSGWLCWDKRENITRNSFADCELAWTSEHRPARIFHHLWNGLHKGSQHGEARRHPTEKPVALFAWVIEQLSEVSTCVLDPYCGSGTTLVAAHQLNRIGYGIEIDPGYVAVALERLSTLGLTPKLLSS